MLCTIHANIWTGQQQDLYLQGLTVALYNTEWTLCVLDKYI